MHSLIEIGQVVLDKKRPFKIICNTILSNRFYPTTPFTEEHSPSFEQIEGCDYMN